MSSSSTDSPLVGVLALQGAFEEHQHCLEAVGCKTVQVRACLSLLGSSDAPTWFRNAQVTTLS